jgi:hypothetical protein
VLIAETFSYAVLVVPFPCGISCTKWISIFLMALLGFSHVSTFLWHPVSTPFVGIGVGPIL